MSKRFNNKILIIILVILGGILVLTEFLKKTEKNLKTEIVAFNADEVNKIEVKSKDADNSIIVLRKGANNWQVTDGERTYQAESETIDSYFEELLKIKSQRLAAKSKNKWSEFQLTDSAATQIKLFNEKNKSLLNILIGKFSYKQIQDPYGRNNIQGISYVRLADEEEIYAVDGFLPMSLNKNLDDWRNKTLIKLNKGDIKKVSFVYPDSSYTLELKDSVWYAGNLKIDSKKAESFLSGLQNKKGFNFNNDFQAVSNPIYQLKIEGDNLMDININCYEIEEGKYIIHSNQNKEAFFDSDENGLVNQIFKPLDNFI